MAEQRLISQDPRIANILDSVRRIADTDVNILITGESGTGKTLLAREIYRYSNVKNENFIILNCAAIPEHLLESELFGYKRGAFTDARENRQGLIESADGGTLVFDEIGDMPLSMQAKILQLIQEKQFRKLGDNKPISVDVRVITATNKDLGKAIAEGAFRQDLFYRLNTIHFHIPPLRERKNDIPELIDHFMLKYAQKYDKHIEGIEGDTLSILLDYEWPGNIRELEHLIEQLVLLERRSVISNHNLPLHLKKRTRVIHMGKGAEGFVLSNLLNFKDAGQLPTLEEVERYYVTRVYEHTRQNKKRTAEILAIDRSTLYNKLRQYGLLE